jgi:hypothetical protein
LEVYGLSALQKGIDGVPLDEEFARRCRAVSVLMSLDGSRHTTTQLEEARSRDIDQDEFAELY